ncbi:MAG: hypothetical protein NT142_01885, partial [Planctomycetota bacterium]|nr:hypothetical protein [Planctomycetota bacterium]
CGQAGGTPGAAARFVVVASSTATAFPVSMPSMTGFVAASMRSAACGDALRDRGWAITGGMAHHLCGRHRRLPTHLATMNPLFNSWIGLLEILNSTGKLTITANGGLTDSVLGGKFLRSFQVGIKLISTSGSTFSAIVPRLLRPVVDPATEQASGIRV